MDMKKKFAASILIVASMFAGYFVSAADDSDRPAGVEAANWIQMNDKVGFVVIPERNSGPRVASAGLLLEPAASGYFMAKTPGGWRRLVVVESIKGPGTAG
jgi:hypothetical protein